MNDPVRTDRDRASAAGSSRRSPSLLRRLAGQILDQGTKNGPPVELEKIPGIRIDQSHAQPGGRTAPPIPPDDEDLEDDSAGPTAARPASSNRSSRREEEVLRQTTQIAAHLRSEREELERREKALHEQHALLDQEWRSARLWVNELEEDMLKRQSEFKAREDDLNEKIGSCETLISDLEEQERVILGLRDQIAGERANLRAEVDHELEVERLALKQTRHALEEERRALAGEFERRRREHEESSRALGTRLELERNTLRSQLESQLQEERAVLERERSAWNAKRAAEEELLSNRRNITESAAQRVQGELSAIRQREFEELRREREALESQLAAQREIIEQEHQKLEVARRQSEEQLAELKKLQIAEIEQERQRVHDETEASRRELETARSQIEQDLKQRVDERESGLRNEQQRLEDQHREQLARLEQERKLLENRIRFQQDHLQKARQEVEAAQLELRKQHQTDRADLEQREAGVRLRWEQLANARSLLEEREQSLAREHALVAERKKTLEADLALRLEALHTDRAAWEVDRKTREDELHHREEALAADSERLDSRRQRLDGLRIELEDTHRSTLEMRMAIEEVWAQLSQQVGLDDAKRRLAETQRVLDEDFQHVRAAISDERRQLAELQAAQQFRHSELERERIQARQTAEQREAALERERKTLDDATARLHSREDELARLREEWVGEKLEVEEVLRNLLAQLSQQAEAAASEPQQPAE
jgi:hypothetical protein